MLGFELRSLSFFLFFLLKNKITRVDITNIIGECISNIDDPLKDINGKYNEMHNNHNTTKQNILIELLISRGKCQVYRTRKGKKIIYR